MLHAVVILIGGWSWGVHDLAEGRCGLGVAAGDGVGVVVECGGWALVVESA
jgi:hypothetical protein